MNDLLERADPAAGYETDSSRLRALIDERIGVTPLARPRSKPLARPWVIAAATFALVLAVAVPVLINRGEPSPSFPIGAIADLPGVEAVIPLASGGVQTMAIDGEDIWVVTALQNVLQRISMTSNEIEETFPIDGHVEGVILGDGYLWLLSYDNGGEVLRFDPAQGLVDLRIPLGGLPNFGRWYDGRLFANNDQGEYLEISSSGDIAARSPGTIRGEGLGLLWVYDAADGSIRSLSGVGTLGQYVIPGATPEAGDLSVVRGIEEAGGYLWLVFGDAGESVVRFDPATGELQPLHVGRWIHGTAEHQGALWLTSYTDDLLFRVDPASGEIQTFALPGRPGGIEFVGDQLWALLYQPGALLRMDPSQGMMEMGPEIAALTSEGSGAGPHTLFCTLNGADAATLERAQNDRDFTGLGPTIILEGPSWISLGIWSVVQAQVEGHVVCASGRQGETGTPEQRAADLAAALATTGIPGPYELVAAGDGVHTVRLFAEGRDDITGVVLVEPIPVGFQQFYDDLLGEEFAHPLWLDLAPAVSDSLSGLGDIPLTIVSHEAETTFLSDVFVDAAGEEKARAVSDKWEEGMSFYSGLSTDSRRVTVPDTGFEGVLWFRPDLVLDAVNQTVGTGG